jgi:hypothetical protein
MEGPDEPPEASGQTEENSRHMGAEADSPSRHGRFEKEDDLPHYDGKGNERSDEYEDPLEENEAENEEPPVKAKKSKGRKSADGAEDDGAAEELMRIQVEEAKVTDPEILAQIELIENSMPSTPLEIAYKAALQRKEVHLNRLTNEIDKLKQFISKRKQTYKRKRKDDGAPTRALSAYNIFIQDRFARLAKENENALKSEDVDATMKRVPPASLVAATGNAWKLLPAEEKKKYEERYVLSRGLAQSPPTGIFVCCTDIHLIFLVVGSWQCQVGS